MTDPAVTQVDALHVGAVFQLVRVAAPDELMLGDGCEPGVVRPGGQGPQLHPPHKANLRVPLPQGRHLRAGNAAVAHDDFLHLRQIGQQLLHRLRAFHFHPGKVDFPGIGGKGHVPPCLLPDKPEGRVIPGKRPGLLGGNSRLPQVHPAYPGQQSQRLTQLGFGAGSRHQHGGPAVKTFAPQLHPIADLTARAAIPQGQQLGIVPAAFRFHQPEPG